MPAHPLGLPLPPLHEFAARVGARAARRNKLARHKRCIGLRPARVGSQGCILWSLGCGAGLARGSDP